ncbi:MAG: biotin--[Oscillospiraceae bacterium]|nr:biotin--[acetyl-CoA-carboxylase] ligase [Oscillospiraceae bacterium]
MRKNVLSLLPDNFPWRENVHYFDKIESTNTRAKEMASAGSPHGTVLMADTQTGGRGRMGRSFLSPAGTGIYLSVILRPRCTAQELMHLTCAVGVAVCDAIESVCKVRPGIKWINDLILNGKKLGGILTELSLDSAGKVDYAVVGIGTNVSSTPDGVEEIATSLWESGCLIDRNTLIAAILVQLEQMSESLTDHSVMEQYRKDCLTIGQEVCVIRPEGVLYGKALDIDAQGGLLVRYSDGKLQTVSSGEVSVRGMYGYV